MTSRTHTAVSTAAPDTADAETAVLGTLPSTLEDAGAAVVRLPCINLLPPEIGERARFERIRRALAGGLLATVGVVAALHLSAASDLERAGAQLETAKARSVALRTESATFADVQGVYASAAQAQEMLSSAMGQEVRFSQFLDDLSLTVPEGIWLKSATFTQAAPAEAAAAPGAAGAPAEAAGAAGASSVGTVTFTGVGFSHDDVAAWLESLAKQKGYVDPSFTDSTTGVIGKRHTVTFTSTVTLTTDALSGRYAAPAGG